MKTLTTHILPAGTNDLDVLREIGIRTFTESFSSANTVEDMALYLAQSFDGSILLRELEDPSIHYYLAYSGETPVGYLKLNFGEAQKEVHPETSLEIERIYILKEFQGRNIGQDMIEKALNIAVLNKIALVWLGVWEKNPGAIRFYKRNGFVEYGKHGFKLGTDEQTDILMKLKINHPLPHESY